MLRIRFQRQGRRKAPFYRVVVAEHTKPVKGRFLEIVGHFNPQTKETSLNKERVLHWLKNGALPTDRVATLCVKNGISECKKYIEERQMKPSRAERDAVEAAKKASEEKAAAEKAAAEAPVVEAPAEEAPAEEAPAEEAAPAEAPAESEAPAEEAAPAEETPAEAPAEAPAEEEEKTE